MSGEEVAVDASELEVVANSRVTVEVTATGFEPVTTSRIAASDPTWFSNRHGN